MDIHEAGLGPHGGRHHARQERGREFPRGPATSRHKALEGRMGVIGALEHASGGMGDIVEARTAQPVVLKQGGRFLAIATAVFEVGSRATHLGDESFEPLGNRFPRPGIAHRYAHTVAMAQSGSPLTSG